MSNFWQFKNQTETEAELLLYGPISETSWWGDEVTPKQFAEDLKNLGPKQNINVRINSGGGDVFAANAIYTLLKDNPAKVTVKVDGIAASAATVVAMAGDDIQIPANGLMMVHDPAVVLWGAYNADELDKMSDVLATIKASIIAAYRQKTKMSDKELSKLMSNETWMTGTEAVEKGFANTILFDDFVQNSISNDGHYLVVNNVKHDLTKYQAFPLQNFKPLISSPQPLAVTNTIMQKGDELPVSYKTLEELKNACPDLVKQIEDAAMAEGRKLERTRIQDIEKISKNLDPALVNKAKFEEPMDAKELAFEALKKDAGKGEQYLTDAASDSQNSGVNNVGAAPVEPNNQAQPQTITDRFRKVAASIDARRRGVEQ